MRQITSKSNLLFP